VVLVNTGQPEMLDQLLAEMDMPVDFDPKIMTRQQSLADICPASGPLDQVVGQVAGSPVRHGDTSTHAGRQPDLAVPARAAVAHRGRPTHVQLAVPRGDEPELTASWRTTTSPRPR
jgi:UDP-N-acetylglucosamine 2-epimerase